MATVAALTKTVFEPLEEIVVSLWSFSVTCPVMTSLPVTDIEVFSLPATLAFMMSLSEAALQDKRSGSLCLLCDSIAAR